MRLRLVEMSGSDSNLWSLLVEKPTTSVWKNARTIEAFPAPYS